MDKELISQHIDRIVSSELLSRSPSLCRFLRFVVQEQAQGRGESLKEYVIGVHVFQKDEGFDPRLDPIVRVQARKLRERLSKYYQGPGARDLVVIELPKGGYAPLIRSRQDVRQQKPRRQYWVPVVVAALLVTVVVLARWSNPDPMPPITVKQLTFGVGATQDPAISSDGQFLAYSADTNGEGVSQIWMQPLEGGDAVRITSSDVKHVTPDFSPDGSSIVYRSFRDGGGIYVSSVSGGQERKIADGGFLPRFSPDSAWIVFSEVESGTSSIYAAPASGGPPTKLSGDTRNATCPVWSPNGKHLAFLAADQHGSEYDLWISAFPSGPCRRLGAAGEFRRITGSAFDLDSCSASWIGDRIIMWMRHEVWQIGIDAESGTTTGRPTQLLAAPVLSQPRAVANLNGRDGFLYAVGTSTSHIWSLPIRGGHADVGEPLEQLTSDASVLSGLRGTRASLSGDGLNLAYDSERSGTRQVWLKDLVTGSAKVVTPGDSRASRGLLSRDGKTVAYWEWGSNLTSIYVLDLVLEIPQKVCWNCGQLQDWSADGQRFLAIDGRTLSLVKRDGSRVELLNDPRYEPQEAIFSPDANWIALATGLRDEKDLHGYLAPLRDDHLADPVEWVFVTKEPYNLSMHWAPSADVLYFFQLRDGFRCLWAQDLDPSSKQPVGPAFAVRHFHSSQHYPTGGSWLSVTRDRIAMTLTDHQSNIWMAEIGPRLP